MKFLFSCILSAFLTSASFAATVDQTEIQWLLCEKSAQSLAGKLQEDFGDAKARTVYYAETENLDLLRTSAVIRIREDRQKLKSTVKTNYKDDQNLPWDLLAGADSKCEWDRHGDVQKVGCSLNHKAKSWQDYLSKDQKVFLQKEALFTGFAALEILGPVPSQSWEWLSAKGLPFSLEIQEGPEGFRSMELSTRAPTSQADQISSELQLWLKGKNVELCEVQSGKGQALIRLLSKHKRRSVHTL